MTKKKNHGSSPEEELAEGDPRGPDLVRVDIGAMVVIKASSMADDRHYIKIGQLRLRPELRGEARIHAAVLALAVARVELRSLMATYAGEIGVSGKDLEEMVAKVEYAMACGKAIDITQHLETSEDDDAG